MAFELNGPAWRDIERRLALQPQMPERHFASEWSRLVPVDASLDFDALLTRYPQDHLILRASIGLGFVPAQNKGPLVYGRIRNVIPSAVTVPHELSEQLLPRGARVPPHYDIEMAVGRLGIPFVTGISNVRQRSTVDGRPSTVYPRSCLAIVISCMFDVPS